MSNEHGAPQAFAVHLKELIAARELSQSQVASRSGLSQSIVSRLCTGDRKPSMNLLFALTKGICCSMEELVAGTEQEHALSQSASVERIDDVHRQWVQSETDKDIFRRQLAGEKARADSATRKISALQAEQIKNRAIIEQAKVSEDRARRAEDSVARLELELTEMEAQLEASRARELESQKIADEARREAQAATLAARAAEARAWQLEAELRTLRAAR